MGNAEEDWETFRDTVLRSARNVWGCSRRKSSEWWKNEVGWAVVQRS